jgi:hypothetical protein
MTKPYAHIVGQRDGEDLHGFELAIDFTSAAMARLGRAIVLHDLRVINTFYVRPPPGPHHTIWMEVTIPASKVDAARAELGRSVSSWGRPARPSAGIWPPTPTWGELRDQVDALLREHRGPMLPCGHPMALLVFDAVDGATYRCPQCVRDKADYYARSGDQP